MNAPDTNEYERQQNFALRMATSTPQERRSLLRQQRQSPQTTRRSHVLAGLLFIAVLVVQLVKEIAGHASALTIGIITAAIVLSGAMAELSRRGRTRLGRYLLIVGFIALGLVESTQR